MFTSWDQIKDWIQDNNFQRWIFFKNNPQDRETIEKGNDKIVDSNNYPSDMADKLAMTEKYLRMNGGHVYGIGYKSTNCTSAGGTICEARIEGSYDQMSGVGQVYQPLNEAAIEDRIRKQIKAEMAAEKAEEERKNFEKEKAEFKRDTESVIGTLIRKLAPYAPIIDSIDSRRMVAGVDTAAPVMADPVPEIETPEDGEDSPFTDEEADKLFELLARFKKVEPRYLELIESVVQMAESGDSTYTMAKGFLLK